MWHVCAFVEGRGNVQYSAGAGSITLCQEAQRELHCNRKKDDISYSQTPTVDLWLVTTLRLSCSQTDLILSLHSRIVRIEGGLHIVTDILHAGSLLTTSIGLAEAKVQGRPGLTAIP